MIAFISLMIATLRSKPNLCSNHRSLAQGFFNTLPHSTYVPLSFLFRWTKLAVRDNTPRPWLHEPVPLNDCQVAR